MIKNTARINRSNDQFLNYLFDLKQQIDHIYHYLSLNSINSNIINEEDEEYFTNFPRGDVIVEEDSKDINRFFNREHTLGEIKSRITAEFKQQSSKSRDNSINSELFPKGDSKKRSKYSVFDEKNKFLTLRKFKNG